MINLDYHFNWTDISWQKLYNNQLMLPFQAFVDSVGPLLSRQEHQKILVATHRTLLSATRVPLHVINFSYLRSFAD